jgi:hypothetical protein
MKKDCNDCRANNGQSQDVCMLGYKTKGNYDPKHGLTLSHSPLEVCPKPRTYKQFIDLKN